MALPRLPLARVDLARDTAGLPPSLIDAIEAEGGLWYAGDAYTSASEAIDVAQTVGARALRLDFADLSLLEQLPDVRYLHIRSDRRPVLDPVANLAHLRALIVEAGAQRGDLDPMALPDLTWLRVGLGGKSGAAMAEKLARGHPRLRWLSVSETKATTVSDLAGGFPELRSFHVHYADRLRRLGPLADRTPALERLTLFLTGIVDVAGLAGLADLTALVMFGGRVTDLAPLTSCRGLRYAQIELPRVTSLDGLRVLPHVRMLILNTGADDEADVLKTLPVLEVPDVRTLARDDPLRLEWTRAVRG